MTITCLINGEPGAHVPADDRGLHYGDGLFETLTVRDGVCEFWDRHMQRLCAGCERLGIPPPSPELLRAEAAQLVGAAGRGVLKIIVTRGRGGRGYQPPQQVEPMRLLRIFEAPAHPAHHAEEGVRVRLCTQRLGWNAALAGIKHLNRLEQVLARMEWDDPDIAEGLMSDQAGNVIEGTFTNLFAIFDGHLFTPALNRCGVAGIMRGVIMELAATEASGCAVRDIPQAELLDADGLFLSNSVLGLWPVRELDGRRLRVGELTRHLQQRLADMRAAAGAPRR
ncbi:MAG: aminodeoxychorismate lyase [Gammaproteobacteria bacterium]